ncbi:MAG: endonuclease/exonuclease/phosphatase family protein [Calditrichaceae bacterium]|jgi:endonuclease/exonuclease/phosphatase family metal-dependent hydrolase
MYRKIDKILITLILLLVLSCRPISNYMEPDKPVYHKDFVKTALPAKDTIKVVTFNIKYAEEIDKALEELDEVRALRDADIILLQEMDNAGTYTIAKYLDYNYLYYPASLQHSGKDFGNAILSKWPIEHYKKIILPYESPLNKRRRIAVTGVIDMGNTQIFTCSVHIETPWLETEYRVSQADSLIRSIPGDYNYVIVGGDFNTASDESVELTDKLFKSANFTWITDNIGWTQDFMGIKKFSLDHIFTKGMRLVDAGKFKETKASDHLPVWATLVIE